MKIGSINVRGLGNDVKKEEVHSLFMKNSLDVCCIQETKMETFSEKDGKSIWRSNEVGWSWEGANGRSGGLLTFWDVHKFDCTSHWGIGGAVVLNGRWRTSGEEFCIINIYAPCNRGEKLMLWDRLNLVVGQREEINTCIIGDFNSILEVGERVGVREQDSARERREFSEFIERSNLIDLELNGRRFTWYKSDGSCKSRIDRALVNEKWANRWQDSELRGLPRSVSDHCAIVLTTRRVDWGPKPFRFINAWLVTPGFKEMVAESWGERGISGWGSYVLKEKLKRLREKLKAWNRDSFGHLDENVKALRDELNLLDSRDDAGGLGEGERMRRNEVVSLLFSQLCKRKSLLSQKAKLRWVKEGDVNSKVFHRAINRRRNNNSIGGLELGGEWVVEPDRVKAGVREFFQSLFQKKLSMRVEMPSSLVEVQLEEEAGLSLVREFSEEEVKYAIWECEGSKSPGPDGFNLEFFRGCWDIVKEDVMRMLREFHENGKLSRGCNSSLDVEPFKKHEGER